jgi:hypothetical protein
VIPSSSSIEGKFKRILKVALCDPITRTDGLHDCPVFDVPKFLRHVDPFMTWTLRSFL